jgi:hypothetical protein
MHQFDLEDKKERVRQELLRLAEVSGKTPTRKSYKREQKVRIGLEQVEYLYGGKFSAALIDAGLTPNPKNQPPRAPKIPETDLIEEFIRVCNLLGKIPGKLEFRSLAKFSWRPYQTNPRWGSWDKARDYIAGNFRERFRFEPSEAIRKVGRELRRKSLSIDCPLVYEPSNEYETIVLFCLLAKELGYRIKAVKSSFPDAILEKDGKEITAEFEFLSSNYVEHAHPCQAGCICICWRRDMDISGIEIFSIEEYLRSRKSLS